MGIQERKEREKEQRKEEILSAAQKVFFEKGLQIATVDEIAESAELSKGTIYLYYKSKEDLYVAVLTKGMQLMQDMFKVRIRNEPQTLKALLSLVDAYIEFFRKHRNYFRMFQFLQTPQFHKQVSDEMKEAGSQVSLQTWDLATGLVQRGMDEGLLISSLSAGEAAVILWLSATAMMQRIDTEAEMWKHKMNIDLDNVLHLSLALYLDSLLTPVAKKEYAALLRSFHSRFATPL